MRVKKTNYIPLSLRRPHRDEHYYTDQEALSAGPRSVLRSMLMPDEKLLQVGVIGNGIYWKSIAVMLLGVVVVVFAILSPILGFFISFLGLSCILYGIGMFLWAYLIQQYLLLAATDKRVIIRFGVFNLEVVQMMYNKIESSEVYASFMGRYLGYASVVVSGTGGHTMVIPYVINAAKFRNIINDIMMKRDDLEQDSFVQ